MLYTKEEIRLVCFSRLFISLPPSLFLFTLSSLIVSSSELERKVAAYKARTFLYRARACWHQRDFRHALEYIQTALNLSDTADGWKHDKLLNVRKGILAHLDRTQHKSKNKICFLFSSPLAFVSKVRAAPFFFSPPCSCFVCRGSGCVYAIGSLLSIAFLSSHRDHQQLASAQRFG
jgi:hypothetical protein